MGMITQEQINDIRSSIDIVELISGYIPLTQRGRNYFGVCPFHDDHSPSMSVSKEKQIYTCFSCGATGNAFKFVMDYENINFPEAIKLVANKAGIDIDVGNYKTSSFDKNKELYEIYDLSSKFYHNNINTINGKSAKKYLYDRDFNDEIIKEFQIGLALKERDILTKLLIKKSFSETLLIKSGLIVRNENGLSDIYYNRIMFPLTDITGKIVGFSGRIFNGENTSKYINTKETEIFKKGELLYNYHRAKDECRIKQTVIIMEGFVDVIRAYSIGVKNVVATMGTAITKNQALLMKRLAKDIILCFDGDEAGAKATINCSNELLSIGVTPKIIRLEDGMDPDEYIRKKGAKSFINKLENPINIMDFKLSYFKNNRNLNNSVDTAKYINDIIKELSKIDDEILRELTLKKISEESKLEINFLRKKLEDSDTKSKKEDILLEKTKPKLVKYQKAEVYLLYYMIHNKEVIKIYNKKITYMPTEKYRMLAREISYFYKLYNYINVADLISFLSNNEQYIKTIGEIESLNLKDEYTLEEIDDYINVIKDYNIKYEIDCLKEKMKNETDSIIKAEIAQKIVDLKVGREIDD